ncbi:ATP-binding protein [Streptomyces sp. NPDC059627]|uniref:ATP-binding protein n=1 Tax=Streptomyces sp. GbtcB6 TaxID=2824751 RepID=UPI001C2FF717|nr:ATP-binding protein [Streptomyces sp. GbtcB6]
MACLLGVCVATGFDDHDHTNITDTGDSAALVATELVTNAWRHAGGALEMRLIWDGRTLTVEVDDTSSTSPAVLAPDRRGSHGGYGLALVNSLAEAWGTYGRPNGKTVWARCVLA